MKLFHVFISGELLVLTALSVLGPASFVAIERNLKILYMAPRLKNRNCNRYMERPILHFATVTTMRGETGKRAGPVNSSVIFVNP